LVIINFSNEKKKQQLLIKSIQFHLVFNNNDDKTIMLMLGNYIIMVECINKEMILATHERLNVNHPQIGDEYFTIL
jgi:hypothetical protein